MDIKKLLGNKIREIRIKKGFTQETLAEKLNLSAKSLSQIELGNNFVSAETLSKLCSTLDVKPKTLFDFDENNSLINYPVEIISEKIKNNKKLLKLFSSIIDLFEY